MKSEAVQDSWFAWVVVLGSFMTHFAAFGTFYSMGVFYSVFLKAFGEPPSITGLPAAFLGVMFLGGGVPAGMFINKFDERTCALVGSVLIGLSYILTSLAEQLWVVCLTSGVIQGVGVIMLFQPSPVIVNKWHNARRPLAVGIAVMGSGVGAAVIGPVLHALIDTMGWRWAMRVLGLVLFSMAVVGALTFHPIESKAGMRRLSLMELAFMPEIASVLVAISILPFVLNCFMAFFIAFALASGIPSSTSYRLMLWWGIASMAARLSGAVFNTKKRRLRSFVGSLLCFAACPMLLGLFMLTKPDPGVSQAVFTVVTVLHGAMNGCFVQLVSLVMADVAGLANLPNSMGLVLSIQAPVTLASTPLFGLIIETFGFEVGFIVMSSALIIMGPALCRFLTLALGPERRFTVSTEATQNLAPQAKTSQKNYDYVIKNNQ